METSSGIEAVTDFANRVRESVQSVIVGNEESINIALVALLCRGHILVEDVPGIGKTTMSKTLAQSLGCTFNRIQFTPDLMPSDVLGINFFNQKTSEFEFLAGPIGSQIVLADEINRATPRTQSALLEAMQERQTTVDGVTRPLPDPFLVMATQNPIEMEGTFPLPEAQLDRFMIRLTLGYPSPAEELEIYSRFEKNSVLPDIPPITGAEEISRMQDVVPTIRMDDSVREYLLEVIRSTRDHSSISLGASPRGGMALYKSTQSWAAINGRDFVTPEDVKKMVPAVLPHRIILSSDARLKGDSPGQVVQEILSTVPVPIER